MKPIPRKKLEKSLLTEKINKSMKKQREVNSHRVFQFTGKLQENLKKSFFKFFLLKKLPLRQEKVLVVGENAYFCIKIVSLLEKNWLGYFLRISFFLGFLIISEMAIFGWREKDFRMLQRPYGSRFPFNSGLWQWLKPFQILTWSWRCNNSQFIFHQFYCQTEEGNS